MTNQIFLQSLIRLTFELFKDLGVRQRLALLLLQDLLLPGQCVRILSGPVQERGRLDVGDLLQGHEERRLAPGVNLSQDLGLHPGGMYYKT